MLKKIFNKSNFGTSKKKTKESRPLPKGLNQQNRNQLKENKAFFFYFFLLKKNNKIKKKLIKY